MGSFEVYFKRRVPAIIHFQLTFKIENILKAQNLELAQLRYNRQKDLGCAFRKTGEVL